MSSFSFEHKSTKYSSNCSVYLDDGDLSKYLRSDKSFDNSYFLNSQNTALSSEENCSENSLSFMTQTELESEVFFPQARQDYFFDGVLPKVEVPSPPVPRKPTNLINLPSKILDRIAQYISQEDAINLATTCFKLLEPCRKRIFKKLVFANSEEEVKILKKEKHLPSTIVPVSKIIQCFDTIRLGDPVLATFVKEIWCFAELNWESSSSFTINDSWYLTSSMFKNLEVLMIPRLPIVKFQILPNDIRLKLKTLCVGLCNNNNSVSNIYKNDILSFPNVENLIINLDNSTDPTFIGLVSNFLIWGETLDQIKKLTITGNCNDAISPTNIFNNENSNFQHGSSQFPQDQSLQYNKVSEETIKLNDIKDTTIENKRKSLNKISFKDKFKQNFKTCNYQSNNKNSSLSSCKVDFSDGILSSGNNTVYTSTPINTYNEKSLDNQKKITNSSSWINILEQITNFRKLKLKNLTLTKLLMESRDLDILLRSIEFFTLESLELTDILTTYDHDSCQLNSQISILLDLAPYLNRLKKLALNIKFSCKICHYDCLGYGKSHILKFFRNLSSRNLETIHLTTWEIYKIKPEMFYPFISTLKKFSWTNPKKLKSFISLVTASDKMLYDFWKEDFIETCNYESLRIKENLKTHLENNILNTVLIDDCQSPNLFKLNTFSQREEIILHNYKYQLLNVFGKTIEDFQKTFPHLELLSFFEIKFKK